MVVGHSGHKVQFGRKLAGFVGICGVAAAIIMLGNVSPAHAAPAPERILAGIKIFSPSEDVLKKFGTPDEVRIGDQSSSLLTDGAINIGGGAASDSGSSAGGPGGPGGPGGGYPGAGGAYPGSPGPGMPGGASGGYPRAGGGYPGGAPNGGYPGRQGGGYPGSPMGGRPGYPGGMNPGGPNGAGRPGGANGSATSTADSTVTWVYDRPDGTSLEFTLSSGGRVIQIHLSGFKSVYRTARGVGLGMTLGTVSGKYGFPESQNISGRVLNMNYIQKFHAAFQFLNQKLVGIIVAAVD